MAIFAIAKDAFRNVGKLTPRPSREQVKRDLADRKFVAPFWRQTISILTGQEMRAHTQGIATAGQQKPKQYEQILALLDVLQEYIKDLQGDSYDDNKTYQLRLPWARALSGTDLSWLLDAAQNKALSEICTRCVITDQRMGITVDLSDLPWLVQQMKAGKIRYD